MERSSICCPELDAILAMIMSSWVLIFSAWRFNVARRLSIERIIAVLIDCIAAVRSDMRGFCSLLLAMSLSLCSTIWLYSAIWFSISVLVKPELAGIRAVAFAGSVR